MVFPNLIIRQFGNNGHATADGAEFELTQQLGDSVRVDANLAYVDARDNRDVPLTDQPIGQVPHWMGNLGLLWNPMRDLTFGAHWNHVGARVDARPASGKYDLVDVSATQRALFGGAAEVEVGVSNLFDKRVVVLAPTPFGSNPLPYQDRTAFVRASWRW